MEADVKSITSIQSTILDLPPSCIEFSPVHSDYFVIGTYNLQKDEQESASHSEGDLENGGNRQGSDNEGQNGGNAGRATQSRNGSIIVYKLEDRKIHHVLSLAYPSAILDLHFHPTYVEEHPGHFAVVSSTGTLSTFNLSPQSATHSPDSKNDDVLTHIATYRLPGVGEDVLITSFCWHLCAANIVALTTSQGHVHIVRLWKTEEQTPLQDSTALMESCPTKEAVITHTLEAWTVAIAPSIHDNLARNLGDPLPGWLSFCDGAIDFSLYSGGDDSTMRYTRGSIGQAGNPSNDGGGGCLQFYYPAVTAKGHTAGVTAILPLPYPLGGEGNAVLTGSYDDHMRVFFVYDRTAEDGTQKTRLLAEKKIGGGVWRLKMIREVEMLSGPGNVRRWAVLASCMHAGACVVEVDIGPGETSNIRVVARFEEHKSMNYGSDYRARQDGQKGLMCVSTSFYDKLLCLWEFSGVSGF